MCRRDGLAHGSALSGLRFTYSGGSPLNPTLKNAVEKLFGQPLHNGYGLTESSPTISHTRLDTPRTDTSVTQSAVVGRLVADGNEEVVAFVELDPQPVIDNRSVAGILIEHAFALQMLVRNYHHAVATVCGNRQGVEGAT